MSERKPSITDQRTAVELELAAAPSRLEFQVSKGKISKERALARLADLEAAAATLRLVEQYADDFRDLIRAKKGATR